MHNTKMWGKLSSFFKEWGSHIVTFASGVLVTVAVVLGYAIYQESAERSLLLKSDPIQNDSQASPSAVPKMESVDPEKAVLDYPDPDAPEQVRRDHFDLAAKLAMESPYLEITNCTGSPVVFKVRQKMPIKVRNNDSVERVIGFEGAKHSIPANSTKEIMGKFAEGPGLYGYGCNDSPDVKGFFFAVQ